MTFKDRLLEVFAKTPAKKKDNKKAAMNFHKHWMEYHGIKRDKHNSIAAELSPLKDKESKKKAYMHDMRADAHHHASKFHAHELNKIKPGAAVLKMEARVLPKTSYTHYVFRGAKGVKLNRNGLEHTIKHGSTFGIRAANSDKNKMRIYIPEHGHTKLFSVDSKIGHNLISLSKPHKG